MSYEFYKVLHVFAALLLFSALGSLAVARIGQGEGMRRLAGIAHGIALVILFVAGFGLLARLGMFGEIPGWAWSKIGVWLLLGLASLLLRRRPEWAASVWLAVAALGGIAIWLAVHKPF